MADVLMTSLLGFQLITLEKLMILQLTGFTDHFCMFIQNIQKRAPSVTVREEWKVLEDGEMDFPRLSKLNLPNVEEPEDL